MKASTKNTTMNSHKPRLHTFEPLRRTAINRAFALVYTCAILTLFYHHTIKLVQSTTFLFFTISLSLFVSDLVLSFMWATAQAYRMLPIHRRVFIENLDQVINRQDFPRLDVFICTADPYKEPPISVVNTALSVMAYEYPSEKISVYVSDDGGSRFTLFAFMEGAKFAKEWLPFCTKYNIKDRCPEAYFKNHSHTWCCEVMKIKVMYESMKTKIENAMENDIIDDEYVNDEDERVSIKKRTNKFTKEDHPTTIQVLLESGNNEHKDTTGHFMPNLVYVSREKCSNSPHNFKAGALNTLLRVSATMTNAPIILTLDCDMYSNDPQTPQRALCYFSDHKIRPNLGYVQFPQRFHGINKNDIYACDYRRMFQICPLGLDGLRGPDYVGTGCFFSRRALFGGPSSILGPKIEQLGPNNDIDKPITAHLGLAYQVAFCKYERNTNWGLKMGFRYGSLCEDTNTGYHLHCEGWRSIFCNPKRAAFLGDAPTNLTDVLIQTRRWALGLLQMGLSKQSPLTFGTKVLGPLMGLCYSHYAFWPIWTLPIFIYGFLPQLALLNGLSIFPKVSDPMFILYTFLFLGAYTQDFVEFILAGGTTKRWWNDQRVWMLRGLTCHLFGSLDFILKFLRKKSTLHFHVTSKKTSKNEEQCNTLYQQNMFDFRGGTENRAMFVPVAMVAIINLVSMIDVFVRVFGRGCADEFGVEVFLTCFVVVNCFPIYEAMIFRTDKGRIPCGVTMVATCLALVMYTLFSLVLWLSTPETVTMSGS